MHQFVLVSFIDLYWILLFTLTPIGLRIFLDASFVIVILFLYISFIGGGLFQGGIFTGGLCAGRPFCAIQYLFFLGWHHLYMNFCATSCHVPSCSCVSFTPPPPLFIRFVAPSCLWVLSLPVHVFRLYTPFCAFFLSPLFVIFCYYIWGGGWHEIFGGGLPLTCQIWRRIWLYIARPSKWFPVKRNDFTFIQPFLNYNWVVRTNTDHH